MIGGITGWLYRVYSIKNSDFSRCDAVVALGYGLLKNKKLPDAEKKTLAEAVRIASKFNVLIVWANSGYLYSGCAEEEEALKQAEINSMGFSAGQVKLLPEGVTNTVTEAEGIRSVLSDAGSKTIVVVADWAHSKSARLIYRKIFPKADIVMRVVEGQWNEDHLISLARSNFRWLFINVVRHLALRILGLKLVSRVKHPVENRTGF